LPENFKKLNDTTKTDISGQVTLPLAYAESIQNRIIKGLGANFLGRVINLASRILLVPLFLKAWGADVYGEWLLLSSITAYLSLTDFGGQLYIVNRLTQAYAQNDITLFRKVLHTGMALFLILPCIAFLVFMALVSLIPLESLLQISKTEHTIVVLVLALLAFQFVFAMPQGIILGIYRAVGLLPRGVMLGNLMQFIQLTLVAGGLWLGGNMLWIACLQILPFLLVALIAVYELNKRFPEFEIVSLKGTELATGRTFVKPSLHFLSIQIAQAVSIQGMILVVGTLLDPVKVVIFSTIRTISSTIRQLLGMVAHSAWPEMTRLDAVQHPDKLKVLFRAILRSTLAGATVFIGIFHFFGGEIYHLWLGPAVEYRQELMDLFLFYIFQVIFWTACGNLLMATNRHHTLSKILLASSLFSIILAYGCGRYFGLAGVISGMILGDLALPFWAVPWLLNKDQAQFSFLFFVKEITPVIGIVLIVAFLPWFAPIMCVVLGFWWLRCLTGLGALRL
jgi:O-antigen/teichoic acid export membrane protein